MSPFGLRATALSIAFAAILTSIVGAGDEAPPAARRKVLVELYTSQGCNACPPASDLMAELAGLGFGPDRIVPLNFHVDYFNDPWADPFADAAFSRRHRSYNDVLKRDDLSFTPLMMVDGHFPLLGSDRVKAVAALGLAGKEPPGVALGLTLTGEGARKSLSVKVTPRTPAATGRDLLVAVAVTEDPVTTRVPLGENAGRTLVEHHVVRRFEHKIVRTEATGTQALTFPLELPGGSNPERFQVTCFAQDRWTGKVYQAESAPWAAPRTSGPSAERARDLERTIAIRKDHRVKAHRAHDLSGPNGLAGFALSTPLVSEMCPDCGSLTEPQNVLRPEKSVQDQGRGGNYSLGDERNNNPAHS